MEKMKSIRFSMLLYVGSSLIAGLLLYLITTAIIDNALINLMDPRPDAIAFAAGRNISITFGNSEGVTSDITNASLFNLLKTVRTISPVVIFSMCVAVGILLFYKNSLQKPLAVLNMGISRISAKELDFTMECDSANELGGLCEAFETMRDELEQTFRSLWKSEENQRNLYRAFAHDLRTPLTVIKGSNDNIELVAAKNNDWNQALQAVSLSNSAITRIELYAEQLRELESIDDWQPNRKETDLSRLAETVTQQSNILSGSYGKEIVLSTDIDGLANMDPDLLLRVLDNLLINALQYARHQVRLSISKEGDQLSITVCDDGPGFQHEALNQVTAPFYSTDKAGGHMGIGLTVSQKLLEKCQSKLSIKNLDDGGAFVGFSVTV